VTIDRYATATMEVGVPAASNEPQLVAAVRRRATRDGSLAGDTRITVASDFPVGAGLGGSSAAGVALAALCAMRDDKRALLDSDRSRLAEWSRSVEIEEMGIAGGWQDHYAAAYGGALALDFSQRTTVARVPLTVPCQDELERRCILAYTGESRISATTITAVLEAYRNRNAGVVQALARMATLARGMRDALAASDIDTLAALVTEHWTHQRSLHPGITTERINALEAAAVGAGAIGIKALGASGGGCVVVFTRADDDGAVADAVAPHASVMEWHVASHGVMVTRQ